jgi:hypothetical protein
LGRAWIVGGWYGVLAALVFADPRIKIREIESIDIDPSVAAIAMSLNEPQVAEKRFIARTADMYQLNYAAAGRPDVVINTSCEHIPDLPGWLGRIPKGTRVLLQSNDYFAVPEHVSAQPSLKAFEQAANLSQIDFAGSLYLRKYTRFMVIGRV